MRWKTILLSLFAFLPLRALASPPPDIDLWLAQNPKIAKAIVWQFPDVIPEEPPQRTDPKPILQPWTKSLFRKKAAATSTSNTGGSPMASCPAFHDDPAPGKSLMWCQWPERYRDRLKTYFTRYWTWMEDSWPLYQQYKDSGFAVKPAGFDERFGSNIDPDTGAEPGTLPFAEVILDKMQNGNDFHYVLYDPDASLDLFLRMTAFQLVLDRGNHLNWKLDDYGAADLAVILNGKYLFSYVPAGSQIWGTDVPANNREGYNPALWLPSPPLVLMKFLMERGLLRDTRFETVSEFFEWERRHLVHGGSEIYDVVGGCDNDFNELQFGFQGTPPLTRVLYGTPLSCTKPPLGYDGKPSAYEINPDHRTGSGCVTTGPLQHQVFRQINMVAENIGYKGGHNGSRYVVEKASFEAMLAGIEPKLPSDPSASGAPPLAALDPDLFSVGGDRVLHKEAAPSLLSNPSAPKTEIAETNHGPPLANAYLDHNDNPYILWGFWEVPERELLLPESTFVRWFPAIPNGAPPEQETSLADAQQRHVNLRMNQLTMVYLPLRLLQIYCHNGDDDKAPYETYLYKNYLYQYSPAELETMGFWSRFRQKFEELGGCENIPPREFRGFPPD